MNNLQVKDAKSEVFTVPAGTEISLDFQGTFVQNLGGDGELFLALNRGAKMKFETGLGRITNNGAEFTSFQLENKTASDITVEVAWGYGDIKDQRLSVAGELQVINKAGDILDVHDDAINDQFTRMFQILQSEGSRAFTLSKGFTNLQNATYAERKTAGTTTVVSAGANTDGIIIHHAQIRGYEGFGYGANISAGASVVIGTTLNSSAAGSQFVETINDYFIPAGVALEINVGASVTTQAMGTIWYEVV